METITEEKIRTLLVPVQTTETREVNIALPYFCKTHEFTSPTLFMVGEKVVIKIYDSPDPAMIVYRADAPWGPKDADIASADISDEQEFRTAFDRYMNYIKSLVQ